MNWETEQEKDLSKEPVEWKHERESCQSTSNKSEKQREVKCTNKTNTAQPRSEADSALRTLAVERPDLLEFVCPVNIGAAKMLHPRKQD